MLYTDEDLKRGGLKYFHFNSLFSKTIFIYFNNFGFKSNSDSDSDLNELVFRKVEI